VTGILASYAVHLAAATRSKCDRETTLTLIQLRPPCGVIRHNSASGASRFARESKV
jgi:hypothetical protein